MNIWPFLQNLDEALIRLFQRYGHRLHRLSLGVLYVWFGLLKPLGHKTTTSVLAQTIYWGDPDVMVLVLGWWEVAIGLCLLVRPLIRVAIFLLALRLPGILLAFVLEPTVLFVSFPFAPTPEGQYLIKDLTLFLASLAIAGFLEEESTPVRYH
jgi:uncharacterized membrane protein YkgB